MVDIRIEWWQDPFLGLRSLWLLRLPKSQNSILVTLHVLSEPKESRNHSFHPGQHMSNSQTVKGSNGEPAISFLLSLG